MNYHIVTLPYDPGWKALGWVKKNCPTYITNDIHYDENSKKEIIMKIDYFFSGEKDAVWFALKWG